jgi:hypothetical protein
MRALPNVAERSWVSGCNNGNKFVLSAGAKAKTVTNNLPIVRVIGRFYFFPLIFFSSLSITKISAYHYKSSGNEINFGNL